MAALSWTLKPSRLSLCHYAGWWRWLHVWVMHVEGSGGVEPWMADLCRSYRGEHSCTWIWKMFLWAPVVPSPRTLAGGGGSTKRASVAMTTAKPHPVFFFLSLHPTPPTVAGKRGWGNHARMLNTSCGTLAPLIAAFLWQIGAFVGFCCRLHADYRL